MVIESARLAVSQLFEPQFRAVLWKSLGLTILMLLAAWFGLEAVVSGFVSPWLGSWPWLTTAFLWLAGAGYFFGAIFLIAPVSALFAGLFLDGVAAQVEARSYPDDRPGVPMAILPSLVLSLKFLLVVAGANLFALLLVLLPGINFAVFFFVNGYLLGREYFQFVAMRFMSEKTAGALRRQNALTVFLAGLIVAGFMAVPLLNLLTPVFATVLMVHLQKRLAGPTPLDSEPASARLAA